MKKLNGFIFYSGPSQLDGKPIVGIATGLNNARKRQAHGANRKTGAMVQTYILRADMLPVAAQKSGMDASICGDCKHRSGSCYVRIEQGPTVVAKAYQRGAYPTISLDDASTLCTGLHIRIGTYGDPTAIPLEYWRVLLAQSAGHTGYTHQWHQPRFAEFSNVCMASCDTAEETARARAMGWRTFSVVRDIAVIKTLDHTMLCPASKEAGQKLQCADCLACDGRTQGRMAHVAIPAHGAIHKVRTFTRMLDLIQIQHNI